MTEVSPDVFLIVVVLSVIGGAIGLIAAVISNFMEKGKEDE